MIKWAELSDHCERKRFETLARTLRAQEVENELTFYEIEADALESQLPEILANVDHLRIGGEIGSRIVRLVERLPSELLTLKAADSFLRADGLWWPKNFLFHAIHQSIVQSAKALDITGAAFLHGTGSSARSAVGALIKLGFKRFTLADPDSARGAAFAAEMRASYFLVQFDFVERHLITQLPAVHSVAINTLSHGRDDGSLSELFYFNFLKVGGVWLDLIVDPPTEGLEAEALAVDAVVIPACRIAARVDCEWVKASMGIQMDVQTYEAALTEAVGYSPVQVDSPQG